MIKTINIKTKKSVSPLIATILLIVVSVILVTVVLTWGKDFTSESLNETKDVFKDSSLTGFIKYERTLGNVVVVRNYHQTESTTITDYEIVSLGDNFWLNNVLSLPSNLELTPGRSVSIDLGCVPEDSFILSLYTTDNKIISINVPSSAQGLNNCSSYIPPLDIFLNNVVSGDFEINEFEKEKGELVINGGFDTDTVWTKSGDVLPIISDGVAKFNNINNNGYFVQWNVVENNKKYRVSFDVTSYTSGVLAVRLAGPNNQQGIIYVEDVGNYIIDVYVGVDVVYIDKTIRFYALEVLGGFVGSIDNVSVVEIDPLPTITDKTKYLECMTDGLISIPSKQAYGTWEFDINVNDRANIIFISDSSNSLTSTQGYALQFSNANREIYFYRTTGSGVITLLRSKTDYFTFNTWYRIKITREINNIFTLYIKGGEFENWTLIDNSGTGANPTTNSVINKSQYFVKDCKAGNKITNIVFRDYVE